MNSLSSKHCETHAVVTYYQQSRGGKRKKNSQVMGLCTLHNVIQISIEAILACHPALSTEWLDWVANSFELWRICTDPVMPELIKTTAIYVHRLTIAQSWPFLLQLAWLLRYLSISLHFSTKSTQLWHKLTTAIGRGLEHPLLWRPIGCRFGLCDQGININFRKC